MDVDKFELNKGRKKDVCGEMTFPGLPKKKIGNFPQYFQEFQ
jgi:hypothetical protein